VDREILAQCEVRRGVPERVRIRDRLSGHKSLFVT
jgi:hypothetical protein